MMAIVSFMITRYQFKDLSFLCVIFAMELCSRINISCVKEAVVVEQVIV